LVIDVEGDGETVPEAGEYDYAEGTVVDLEAIPDDGWEFVRWEGDVADNNDDTTTITMDEDKTVTAVFEEGEYRLTIKIEGEGQTSPTAGRHTYKEDKVVELEAIPDNGWEFVRWEGDVEDEDDDTTTVTMDEDKTVTACFAQAVCELTINVNGHGSTDPAAGKHRYSQDTVVSLKVTPDTGWQFAGWTGDVADTASEDTTITMDEDQHITALFREIAGQTAAVPSSPHEGVDQKSPPPATKSETTDWVIALGIIFGIIILSGVALLILSVKRR
jgi:uncharacterized repeat protein (TIGR02543 family)